MRGGPLDLRLGVSEKNRECATCGLSLVDCPGHFGFVKLSLPVYHVGFFKHVIAILKSICKKCSRVLITEE